ncbi:MAG: autotransporter domain-containing protein [Pseudomonadales bacterium]|nr:autotransporter domain-containing protein [Pseudomonadales bacterium]
MRIPGRRLRQKLVCLLSAVFFTVSATADVDSLGTVTIGDITLLPTTGNLDADPLDLIAIGEGSTLIVNNGSRLSAGDLVNDFSSNADMLLTGSGSQLVLRGAGDRVVLTRLGTYEVLNGAVLDATDTANCVAGACNVIIGQLGGANATLNVSGAGSQFNTSGNVAIGLATQDVQIGAVGDSSGVVNVLAGGVLRSANVLVGAGVLNDPSAQARSLGAVLIDGVGSSWSATTLLAGVDPLSTGVITLSNGGALSLDRDLILGASGGGALSASGTGSLVKVRQSVVLGDGEGASGQLDILSGGALEIGGDGDVTCCDARLVVGRAGGSGAVTVDAGSVFLQATAPDSLTSLAIGLGADGFLGVSNGGTLTLQNGVSGDDGGAVVFGRSVDTIGAVATVDIDGGSLLLSGDGLAVEVADTGSDLSGTGGVSAAIAVRGGGLLRVDGTTGTGSLRLGRGLGAEATLTVDGGTLEIIGNGAELVIGDGSFNAVGDGAGLVSVLNGGSVRVAGVDAGATALFVGRGAGDGTLDIGAGGTVTVDGTLFISTAPSGTPGTQTGVVTVGSGGSLSAIDAVLDTGGTLQGNGTLDIGLLRLLGGGNLLLDDLAGVGTLSIEGASLVRSSLPFGQAGGQAVRVVNGATLDVGTGFDFAATTGTTAAVDILGTGSVATTAGGLVLGNAATPGSSLRVAQGGQLLVTGDALVNAGSSVRVEDTASGLLAATIDINGGALSVLTGGSVSTGTLTVRNGGSVGGDGQLSAAVLRVRNDAVLSLSDLSFIPDIGIDASSLTVQGDLLLGGSSPGQVVAVSGGSVLGVSGTTRLGTSSGAAVAMQLTDTSFSTASLLIGGSGAGSSLTLDSGAFLDVSDTLGVNADGSLFVNGVGSRVDAAVLDVNGGVFQAGADAVINLGTATVRGGGVLGGAGQVNADLVTVVLGSSLDLQRVDGIRALTFDGGALLDTTGTLVIGAASGQTVTVTNGGFVDASGALAIGGAGAPGSLVVSGGSGFLAGGAVSLAGSGSSLRLLDVPEASIGGSLIAGSGTSVTLSGATTALAAEGALQLDGGSLSLVDGAQLAVTQTTVSNGGLLGGTGTLVSGDVRIDVGGTLGPGNSPGTLNVVGDVTLAGGQLLLEIEGDQAGQFDVLNVDGNLDLQSGNVVLQLLNGFTPATGASFDVLTVTGNATLSPDVGFTYAGLGPDFEFTLRSDGQVNIGSIAFLAVDIQALEGLSRNQTAFAIYLDDICPRIEALANPTADEADLDGVCGALRNGRNTTEQVAYALDQLSPDELLGMIDTVLRFTTSQHGNLGQRLNGLRSGASRVNLTGLDILTGNVRVAGHDVQQLVDGLSGGSAGADEDFARWGFFSDGSMYKGDKRPGRHEPGFDFETVNLTLGADYRVSDHLFLGAALGYNEVNGDFDAGGGMLVKATTVSLMGTWFRDEHLYLDVLATYGWSEADTSRYINYTLAGGGLERQARGHANGSQFVVSVGSGYDFTHGAWIVGPHAGGNFTEIWIDDMNERGAKGVNLSIPDQVSRSLTANAGVHVSYTLTPSWGVLVPYARLDLVHEFKQGAQDENIRFAADRFRADPFDPTRPADIRTDGADPNYVAWSVGVHAQFVRGVAAFVNYRGHEGIRQLDLAEWSFGVRLEHAF